MDDERKADLIAQLAQARSQAAANSRALAEDLNVGDKLKENIEHHRAAWLSGAVLTGLLISKVPPRTKQIVVDQNGHKVARQAEKAGLIGIVFAGARLVFNLLRPWLTKWIAHRLSGHSLPSGSSRRRPA